MTVYHQMGHQSDNLIRVPELSGYSGAILSPVNYSENDMAALVRDLNAKESFETIFDPQLYYPRTQREILKQWSYFPNDVDTVDYSSLPWWKNLCNSLAATTDRLQPNAVCSPVIVPRIYSLDYFERMVGVMEILTDSMGGQQVDVLFTLLVDMSELASYPYVMRLASIVTKTSIKRVYLVLRTDSDPRRELSDPEELKGAMLLIKTLEANGVRVIVTHSSTDLVLWKAAGATSAATGKFFNLRRFTPSRWDVNDGGGGQEAYWCEEALLAFLRASDVIRVQRIGLISPNSMLNPFANRILESIETGTPWLRYSWDFYLYWFQSFENALDNGRIDPFSVLNNADRNWAFIEGSRIFMEERRNAGDWIRQWMRAVSEYETGW